jgi:hypothetical protein
MFIDFTGLICFDLETASYYKTLNELRENNARMFDLWNNLCEKKIKAGDIRFPEGIDPADAYYETAGLYPEFGRIINASFSMYREDEHKILVISVGGNDETEIIKSCNTMIAKSTWLAGHNVKGFDVPFFSRRAYINKIMPHQNIDTVTKKPWDVRILDTQEIWRFGSYNHGYTSLDLLTTSLGIESPKLEYSGAHVSNLYWRDNNRDEIARYCESDVISTLKVLLRYSDVDIDLESIEIEKRPMKVA